jgi:hypothetical protein
MAFRDDARAFAEQAQRAIEQGIGQVQERVEEVRRRRQFNELARQLGLLVYHGRGAGGVDEVAVARLSARMAELEADLADPGPTGGYRLDDL